MNKYVIFDLEATCDDLIDNFPKEIIEIGAVMIDEFGNELDRFEMFAKPNKNTILTDFCKKLTTIKQSDVDNADDLKNVLNKFYIWSKDSNLVSWGGYDIRQIKRDCITQKIENTIDVKDMFERHINFKRWYARNKKLKREGSIRGTLRIEGMEFIGTPHRGIDDALNIKRIFTKYIKYL